jgi:hypothetical protein
MARRIISASAWDRNFASKAVSWNSFGRPFEAAFLVVPKYAGDNADVLE